MSKRDLHIESLLRTSLRELGLAPKFEGDDVFVEGRLVGKGIRPRIADGGSWYDRERDELDLPEFVQRYMPGLVYFETKRQVKQRFKQRHWVRRTRDGAEIMAGKAQVVATLTARALTTSGGEYAAGDFFCAGPQWDTALELLLPRKERRASNRPLVDAELSEPRTAIAARTPVAHPEGDAAKLTHWDESAAPELTAAASRASEALRDHRRRADDQAVEIACSASTALTLEPVKIAKRTGRLELPFDLRSGEGQLRGVVYLKSPKTPLALGVTASAGFSDITDAYLTVLTVAAKRLSSPPRNTEQPGSQPEGFTADDQTERTLARVVSSHKRRLREGQHPSVDKVKAAEELGIDLEDGETWVKGHVRGAPIEGTLRFEWSGPRLPM